MKQFFIASAVAVGLGTGLWAQATPPGAPPATPPAAPAAPPPRPQSRPATVSSVVVSVVVTDKSGNGIGDVNVAVSGPVERSGHTAADGSVAFRSMRGGTYRLRFEHERYITLEREVVVGSRASDVSVALNPAPAAKPEAAPPPPVTPPPVQKSSRAVEPRTLSIPDFFEANAIGSEPQKTSLLGCTDGGTARLLQVKEPMTNQVNPDADQVIYVVGGNGTFRVREQDYKAPAGSFVLIPRGATFGARREGRNPLVALTVTMGASCAETTPLAK
jgi:mannose-6-phosphate isomerase-like protein (cupin superfamily)